MILNKFYMNNTTFFTKLIIHILAATAVLDVLWLLIMMSFWSTSLPKNKYWSGLSTLHTFGLLFGFLQVLIKVFKHKII
jgi:hypothetical protein